MVKKKTLCSDTGLYKGFLDLMKLNTEYMKNIDRSYQMMYSQELTKILILCSKSFIVSFNSYSQEEKLHNIVNVRNNLLNYDLIIRVLFGSKVISLKQFSNIGLIISKIQQQLSGYEKKVIENIEQSE